jgi:hypothetical protein
MVVWLARTVYIYIYIYIYIYVGLARTVYISEGWPEPYIYVGLARTVYIRRVGQNLIYT